MTNKIIRYLIAGLFFIIYFETGLDAGFGNFNSCKLAGTGFSGAARWDAAGLGFNPAASGAFVGRALIMGSEVSPFDEASEHSVLYHGNMAQTGFAVHGTFKEVAGIKIIDEYNVASGEASYGRLGAGASVGYKFTRRAAVGMGVKYRRESFETLVLNSEASLDAGAIFGVADNTDMGFMARDVLSGRHNIMTAGLLHESGGVILSADANFSPFWRRFYINCGAEALISDALSFRVGYKTGPAPLEHSMIGGITGGFGLRFGIFDVDYAVSPVMDLGFRHFVGVSALFDVQRGLILPESAAKEIKHPEISIVPPAEIIPPKEFYEQKEKRSSDVGVVDREFEVNESRIKNVLQQLPISQTRPEEAAKIVELVQEAQEMKDRGQEMDALRRLEEASKKTRDEIAVITRRLESQKQPDVRRQEWMKYVADVKVSMRGNQYITVEETKDSLIVNLVGLKRRLGGFAVDFDSQKCLEAVTEIIQKGSYDATVQFSGRNVHEEFRSVHAWLISSGVDRARIKQIHMPEGEEKKTIIIHMPQ